jgi:hypothetical protein
VAAPTSLLKQLNSPALPPGASSARPAPADVERYQLHVFASSIADAVVSAGGLIFDRAMAGWDVTVVVDGDGVGSDDRPIRILGGRVSGPDQVVSVPGPQALAVATDVVVKSEQVRRLVFAARRADQASPRPPNLNCRFVPVHHQPSAAAQVFKSHALAVGGAVGPQLTEEGFYSMT